MRRATSVRRSAVTCADTHPGSASRAAHGKFVLRPVSRFGVAERVFRHAQIVKDEADVAVKVGHFLRDAGFPSEKW